ncbi:CDP-diacylglycerol--inositol 3-phosphatidyltransferase [Papilio xuthus]|uniref:CDP-diacylglycerol--inositol 3-phosphatidyltransferase n=1 Tax=Papilio xuthus TaxID=66420 RepID=A0A194QIK9_PAPXU|nr:CDP-diacylglycerol--inositol 3-phosphatidyltransferase [Papilio xuthus]
MGETKENIFLFVPNIIGTKFGPMLDQLTDRAGTAGLMMTLATFYPRYTFWLQMSMVIDITGHWLYLHTCTLQGKTSHKFIDMSENPIMHVYYTNKTVLFLMCAGNEAFYATLYVMHFFTGPTVFGIGLFNLIAVLILPVAVVKAGITIVHLIVASLNLSIIDVNERAAIAEKQKN